MQQHPKRSRRSLPDGWDEKATKEAMKKAYDSMFEEFTDEAGVLKVTPEVIREVISESG
jgi:hypothetical protein